MEKAKIAADGDYNLSGERYREGVVQTSDWPMVALGELCIDILSGGTPSTKNEDYWKGGIPWITSADIVDVKTAKPRKHITEQAIRESATNLIVRGNIIVVTRVGLGKLFRNDFDVCISQDSQGLILKDGISTDYLVYVLKDKVENFKKISQGTTIQGVTKKQLSAIQIPLPPLSVQQEIVAEIEGYQKVIDGARAVVENYRPHIASDPEWPMVALGELCVVERGASPRPIRAFTTDSSEGMNWIKIGDATIGSKYITSTQERITAAGAAKSRRVKPGDFILSNSMSFGRPYIVGIDGCIHDGWLLLRLKSDRIDQDFLYNILGSKLVSVQFERSATGGVVNNLNSKIVRDVEIPLPPLSVQQEIVAEIEAEQALVDANRELIERMEGKIRAAIGRVWGDAERNKDR